MSKSKAAALDPRCKEPEEGDGSTSGIDSSEEEHGKGTPGQLSDDECEVEELEEVIEMRRPGGTKHQGASRIFAPGRVELNWHPRAWHSF